MTDGKTLSISLIIRTHFGERLLEAATTMQLADLHSDGRPGLHRWYLRQLETLNLVGSKHETSVNLKCGSLPIFIGIHRLSLYSVKASTSWLRLSTSPRQHR